MTKHFLLGILLLSAVSLNAQTSGYYQEAPNPVAVNPALWSEVKTPQVSWGSTDMRYKKEEPAAIREIKKTISLTAWKGDST